MCLMDDVHGSQQFQIDLLGVAYQTQNRIIVAHGDVDLQALIFQPLDQVVQLSSGDSIFHSSDHVGSSLSGEIKKPTQK